MIINWELLAAITAIMLFCYWLVYCMGSPLADKISDVDVGAIFFFFPYWLARRRLHSEGLDVKLRKSESEELLVTSDPLTRKRLRKDHKRARYETGREFFSWERSFLCPICLHWWLTIIFLVVCLFANLLKLTETPWQAGLAYLINHFFIRKIA